MTSAKAEPGVAAVTQALNWANVAQGARCVGTWSASRMTDTVAAASTAAGSSEQARRRSASETATRHPLDPEPVRSTKAAAVLALGVAAVVTGPVLGGIVPATLGLALARQARGDLIAGQGYLTGARQLRLGLTLAWIGIGLAVTALVIASVVGLISLANGTVQDFPDTSD